VCAGGRTPPREESLLQKRKESRTESRMKIMRNGGGGRENLQWQYLNAETRECAVCEV